MVGHHVFVFRILVLKVHLVVDKQVRAVLVAAFVFRRIDMLFVVAVYLNVVVTGEFVAAVARVFQVISW